MERGYKVNGEYKGHCRKAGIRILVWNEWLLPNYLEVDFKPLPVLRPRNNVQNNSIEFMALDSDLKLGRSVRAMARTGRNKTRLISDNHFATYL